MKLLTQQITGPTPPNWPIGCRVTCWNCENQYIIESPQDFKVSGTTPNSTSFDLNCPTCNKEAAEDPFNDPTLLHGWTHIYNHQQPQPLEEKPC